MRPALQPAVPSRRLLRFLRFQSEGIPFFDHCHPNVARGAGQLNRLTGTVLRSGGHAFQTTSRRLSTCRPRRAEVALNAAAPTLDVENILPSHIKRVRTPSACAAFLATNNVVASRRFASTDDTSDTEWKRRQTESQRLWGPNAVKPDFRSRSSDELDDSIFTTGRRAKAALEPVLRCTEVDEKGDAILIDGAFKKSELIAKVRRRPALLFL